MSDGSTSPQRRRGPATFRQRDVRAAIRAVEAAGKEVGAVEVDPTGTVRIILKRDAPAPPEQWELE